MMKKIKKCLVLLLLLTMGFHPVEAKVTFIRSQQIYVKNNIGKTTVFPLIDNVRAISVIHHNITNRKVTVVVSESNFSVNNKTLWNGIKRIFSRFWQKIKSFLGTVFSIIMMGFFALAIEDEMKKKKEQKEQKKESNYSIFNFDSNDDEYQRERERKREKKRLEKQQKEAYEQERKRLKKIEKEKEKKRKKAMERLEKERKKELERREDEERRRRRERERKYNEDLGYYEHLFGQGHP